MVETHGTIHMFCNCIEEQWTYLYLHKYIYIQICLFSFYKHINQYKQIVFCVICDTQRLEDIVVGQYMYNYRKSFINFQLVFAMW